MGIPRIYLTGRVAIESKHGSIVDLTRASEVERIALAILVLERHRPVGLDEIADVLWQERRPDDWREEIEDGLERLGANLDLLATDEVRLDGSDGLVRLILPSDVWVDLEHAHQSLEHAEAAIKRGEFERVVALSTTAAVIGKRPFLPGLESEWINARRARHKAVLIDGLLLRARGAISSGEPDEAVRIAEQAKGHDPRHEPTLRVLMRALDAAGNRVGALNAYEEFRAAAAKHPVTTPTQETQDMAAQLRPQLASDLDTLTPRQREVALLLGEGLTNRRIAERLFISVQTAETHVKHILTKLGLSSRTQVAALVAAHRPTDTTER